jgi:hypothetical protein
MFLCVNLLVLQIMGTSYLKNRQLPGKGSAPWNESAVLSIGQQFYNYLFSLVEP